MRLELFPNIKLIEDVGHLRALSAPSIMSKEHISRSSIDSASTGSSLLASSVSSSLAAKQQTSSTDDEAAAAVEEEEAQYVIKVLGFDFHDPNGWIHLHTKVGHYSQLAVWGLHRWLTVSTTATPVIVEGHQLSILQAIAEAASVAHRLHPLFDEVNQTASAVLCVKMACCPQARMSISAGTHRPYRTSWLGIWTRSRQFIPLCLSPDHADSGWSATRSDSLGCC